MKYIKKVDEKPLWNAGFVELWDFSRANESQESRIEAVATVASICYGKPPKDAKKLVERLWTESGGLLSSAFEFVRPPMDSGIGGSLRHHPEFPMWEDSLDDPEFCIEWHKEVIATFRLKVPIFIARQIMRHRSFSYQELSRRFVDDKRVPLEFWYSHDTVCPIGYRDVIEGAITTYKEMLDLDMRPEVARAVLPQSLYTEFWMQGDDEAWKNYFKLRLDKRTQKEHREVAQAMLELLKEHQPILYEKIKKEEQ